MRLAKISKIFEIPHVATKQVNFGPIDPKITAHHHYHVQVFEKKSFSMVNEQVSSLLKSFKTIDTVVLYGMETHICVY